MSSIRGSSTCNYDLFLRNYFLVIYTFSKETIQLKWLTVDGQSHFLKDSAIMHHLYLRIWGIEKYIALPLL